MESSKIKNIIQTFFDKDVSKKTFYLFSKWFRLNKNNDEKDLAMKEIWENTPSVINEETLVDFSKINSQINYNRKRRYSLSKTIISYASAIALIIMSSVYLTYKIAIPATLEYTQLSVSYGESKKITLADGTIVVVNAGSTLIYPKDFTSNTRTVFLTGEANFNVTKNPDKPFIVKTKYIDIEALGTQFCVQSYPNAKYTKATLIEGSIKVDMELGKNKSYILKPNNQLTYSHFNNEISIKDIDANKVASWVDGYLIFEGATFDEIVQTLERKYNVAINYDGEKLNQQSYFVKFIPDETVEDAMNVLTILINKSSYKKDKSTIYFYTK